MSHFTGNSCDDDQPEYTNHGDEAVVTEENTTLKAKVIDLESSRSRQDNIRLVGHPEGIEVPSKCFFLLL